VITTFGEATEGVRGERSDCRSKKPLKDAGTSRFLPLQSDLLPLTCPLCRCYIDRSDDHYAGGMMARKTEQSRKLQKRAEQLIPGGVNSPVRAFRAVGGDPLYIVRGQGSHIWDADGNEYVDYIGSWGPLILGHAAPAVIEAVISAARNGTSFGASTPAEADLAELVISAFPHMQKVRFVSSGTEATMSAIRLARAYTKRKYIVKFEGCYHGHADA